MQAIAFKHPDHRPTDSEEGSSTQYDINGNTIVLKGDGIHITSPSKIVLTAPDIALDGNVYLGGAVGSGKPASLEGTKDTGGFIDTDNLATKVWVT